MTLHPRPFRVLALQLKRIGDLILTAPALAALQEIRPDAEVTLLVDRAPGGLLPAIPCARGFVRGTPGFWFAAMRGRFDATLDFTGTDRSALLTAFSRARTRATFSRFKKKWPHRLAYNRWVDSSVRDRHTADHHADLLEAIGINAGPLPPGLRIPESARNAARQILEAARTPRPFALLHPGTARPEKSWPTESWISLGRGLQAAGLAPVLTGSESERPQVAAVAADLPGSVDLSGRLTLLELAAAVGEASLFCGVDSAALHLADAAGTPCLGLFGPTNPFHWMPRNAPCKILRAGVTPPFAPGQKGGPISAITPEAALAACHSLLQ